MYDVQVFPQANLYRGSLIVTANPKEVLQRAIEERERQLRERAPDEIKSTIYELEAFRMVLNALQQAEVEPQVNDPAPGGEYSNFTDSAEALRAYLQKHGPSDDLTARKAIVAAGFGTAPGWKAKTDPLQLLKQVVAYQHNGADRPWLRFNEKTKIISLIQLEK